MVKRILIDIKDGWIEKLNTKVEVSLKDLNFLLLERLKNMRNDGKMSIRGLARLSGVSETSLHEWIRGDYLMERWKTLMRLSIALGVKIKVIP